VRAPAAVDVFAAIGIHQRTGASFWDAMILRSAKELDCQALHSEDLAECDRDNGPLPGLLGWLNR
jgi:predicted nucleic acid-binding protein